jgi:hypothetical protein
VNVARVVRKIEIQPNNPFDTAREIPLSVLEQFVEDIRDVTGIGVDPMVNVPMPVFFEYTED